MAVQRLAYELDRQRENETHEREKLALQLENILLRAERGLPATRIGHEELVRLVEELRQENEQLRRRIADTGNA